MFEGVTIRLDKSRPYGTVYGERTPEDPTHMVRYWQDDLPFNAQGILVPPDGRTEPWFEIVETDTGVPKRLTYRPLYDAARHKKLQDKLERINTRRAAPAPQQRVREPEAIENSVNLDGWLRGLDDYTPQEVYKAVKTRYSANFHTLRQCVELLVVDEKLVPESEVAPALIALIETPQDG